MAENSEKRRGPGRQFKAGESGNPGGRPKDLEQTRELARQYTRTAIRTLVKVCKTGDTSSARVAAANALLDRGWGKPVQAVEAKVKVSGEMGLAMLFAAAGDDEEPDGTEPGPDPASAP